MSDLSATDLSALGSNIMPAVLPPDVRKAGAKGEQLYKAALGFEQLLTQELTDQLAQTMQGTDDADSSDSSSGDGSDDPSTQSIFSMGGSSPVVSQMLPQALSDGITQAGGLGIAHQLYLMLARSTGLTTPSGAGTQTPPATGTLPTAGAGAGDAQ
jgi:Rod binding domain-containing protein